MFSLPEIGERLRTQDNLCTADPIFLVQKKQRIYGIDPSCDPEIVWLHADECVEVSPEKAAELECAYQAGTYGKEPIGYRRVGYAERWDFVTCCFTQAAADLFIKNNGHRHRGELRVYVDSAYRNHEWIAVRNLLMSHVVGSEVGR